jgi:pimeloyl-ACP methyl ester carboxylesterase
MTLELKTVATQHTPVRYIEGGSGTPLVFLHGAGGITTADPFLNKLAEKHHVYAPLLPGYGDSEECGEIRDMLDFTLHTWDVVEALGLKNPILVGHSMGGMIAAEMAAIAPNDVTRLGLICPAGLWLDDHPIPDLFATLPYEMPKLLFHNVEAGTAMMTAGLKMDDPKFLQGYLVTNARQLGMAGKILFPIPERGLSQCSTGSRRRPC